MNAHSFARDENEFDGVGVDDDDSIAEMAARHKGDGNRAFQEKRYDDAVAW